MVKGELGKLLPEEDRALILEFLFSSRWNTPTWQRRNLLLQGRTVVRLFNSPHRVEVTLGGREASEEVAAFMGRYLAKEGRTAVNEQNRQWLNRMSTPRRHLPEPRCE